MSQIYDYGNPSSNITAGIPFGISTAQTSLIVDGGYLTTNNSVLSFADSGVAAGSYTSANIVVDSKGRVLTAVDGGSGGTSKYIKVVMKAGTYTTLSTYNLPFETISFSSGIEFSAPNVITLGPGVYKISLRIPIRLPDKSTTYDFTINATVEKTVVGSARYAVKTADRNERIAQELNFSYNTETTVVMTFTITGSSMAIDADDSNNELSIFSV